MHEIEWALLCERVIENNVDGLDLIGVCDRFHMLTDKPARKHLVVRMRAVGVDVKSGVPAHVGDLSITIFRTGLHKMANTFNSFTEAVAWHHGYYVKAIQIPLAERGDYTVQILDNSILAHSFHYSVI